MTVAPTIHLPPGVGRDLVIAQPNKPRLRLIQPSNMTASAVRVTKGNGQDFRRLIQPWQARALSYYDMIGEVWYSAQFYARALGKTRLFAALLDDNGDPQETDDPLLNDLWDRVQGPGGGRAHLQEQYGRLMFITGEGYLTATPDDDWGEVWEFLSSDELRVQPGGVFVRYTAPQLDAITYVDAPDDAFTPIANKTGPDAIVPYRLWRPSPRYSAWADSPMRAVLDICEEIVLLTLAVRSRAKSRAANGGLLLWPQNASMPQLDTSGSEDATNDPFAEELGESMMAPISDPGTASAAVPMLVFMDSQYIQENQGGPRLMQLVDPKDNYGETGLRNEAIRRYALGVDMPPEQLLGMEDANHWCADEQTEVLTDTGWRLHDTLSPGDQVLTLNHETGLSQWQPVLDIYRADVVDEPMIEIRGRAHSSLTTRNHRWPVLKKSSGKREWTTTEKLNTNDFMVTAAPSCDLPAVGMWSDAFVEAVAWLFTEGAIAHRHQRQSPLVTIHQSHIVNPDNVARIRRALTTLYGPATDSLTGSMGRTTERAKANRVTARQMRADGEDLATIGAKLEVSRTMASRYLNHDPREIETEPRWRESVRDGRLTVFHLNVPAAAPLIAIAPRRVVSQDFIRQLTAAQLELFIDTAIRGDGHKSKSNQLTFSQKDPARLDALELAAILAGHTTRRYIAVVNGFTRHIAHCLAINRRTRFGPKPKHIREVAYTGTVWCPRTANGSWFMRRNGRVTVSGNSSWSIDEQSYKAHLQPVTERMCEDFNSAYLRRAAREAGYANWKKVAIGYDATEVINHPDKGKDFMDMYDRRVVSKEALRRAKGAEEDDAMPDDELKESIGVAVRDGSLALYGIPQVRGTGIEPEPGEVEGTAGTEETAPAGPASGAEVEKGPPVAGETEATRPITAAADRIVGAAEMAVERCRELAGQRLVTRVKNRKCQPCLDTLNGNPLPSLVASLLGKDALADIDAPDPLELVAGGTQSFIAAAVRLGVSPEQVAHLADLVELHAARTLHDAQPAPLPAAFHALVQRAAS